MKYAIIQTGGKQYIVKHGDILKVEKIDAKLDQKIILDNVLLVFDETDKTFTLGHPKVEKAEIHAKVLEQERSKKVTVLKFKPKVRYTRKHGHRQYYTKIEIFKILTS